MSSTFTPAGWYPNPDGTGGLRYWNGTRWTEHTHGAGVVAPPTTATTTKATPESPSAEPPRGVGIALIGFAVGAGAGIGLLAVLDAAGNPGGDVVALCVSLLALWAG